MLPDKFLLSDRSECMEKAISFMQTHCLYMTSNFSKFSVWVFSPVFSLASFIILTIDKVQNNSFMHYNAPSSDTFKLK